MSDVGKATLQLFSLAPGAARAAEHARAVDRHLARAGSATGLRRLRAIGKRASAARSRLLRAHVALDAAALASAAFRGTVVIQQPVDALPFAQMVCDTADDTADQLVLWTDAAASGAAPGAASARPRPARYAVAQRRAGRWMYKVGRTARSHGTEHCELKAIQMALEEAAEQARDRLRAGLPAPSLVRVFSDCQSALRNVFRAQRPVFEGPVWPHDDIVDTVEALLQASDELERLAVRLELHWVPRGKVDGTRVTANQSNLSQQQQQQQQHDASIQPNLALMAPLSAQVSPTQLPAMSSLSPGRSFRRLLARLRRA